MTIQNIGLPDSFTPLVRDDLIQSSVWWNFGKTHCAIVLFKASQIKVDLFDM